MSNASTMNPELVELQKELLALTEELRRRQARATTEAELDRLLTEIHEVLHRSVLVGKLLFRQLTDSVRTKTQSATAVVAQIKSTIRTLEKVDKVIKGVSKALTAVDKVIDLAKTAAVA